MPSVPAMSLTLDTFDEMTTVQLMGDAGSTLRQDLGNHGMLNDGYQWGGTGEFLRSQMKFHRIRYLYPQKEDVLNAVEAIPEIL